MTSKAATRTTKGQRKWKVKMEGRAYMDEERRYNMTRAICKPRHRRPIVIPTAADPLAFLIPIFSQVRSLVGGICSAGTCCGGDGTVLGRNICEERFENIKIGNLCTLYEKGEM